MTGKTSKRCKTSLMYQLLLRMSVFIIVPTILITLLFQSVKQIIIQKYSESAQQSVKIAADNIDYLLDNISNISNAILTNHELIHCLEKKEKEEFQDGLNNYYISNFYVEGIYTMTGFGYDGVGAELVGNEQSNDWDVLKETSGEIRWFSTRSVQVQMLTGRQQKQMIMLGRKIIDVSSLKEFGYLQIAVDEGILKEFYDTLENDDSNVIICDTDGNIISDTSNNYKKISILDHPYMQDVVAGANAGYVEYKENDIPYVAIYSTLNNGNWRIIKQIPKKRLYAEINEIQNVVTYASIMFMIPMFLISYIFSKKITEPLKKMIAQMKEVEEGNMDVTVEISTNRELQDLGDNFNHMIYRIKNLMNEVVTTERNKNELELEVLHAQINPHFLYNTLNTIRWMAKLKGENNINDAIVALVKLLRVSISVDKNMITVKEEIDYVESYLLIQKLRFNQMFAIQYDIQPEIENYLIPKLILQPIVENSLNYSIDEAEEKQELLQIRIYSEIGKDMVYLIVSDNGVGMEESKLATILQEDKKDINKFSKVGLNNVNQRVKMYFGEEYGIRIYSKQGEGTRVVIPIPEHEDL